MVGNRYYPKPGIYLVQQQHIFYLTITTSTKLRYLLCYYPCNVKYLIVWCPRMSLSGLYNIKNQNIIYKMFATCSICLFQIKIFRLNSLCAYEKNDVIQSKWPMIGQYLLELTSGKMYTGLALVICIVWCYF